jgi:hypothetical protein
MLFMDQASGQLPGLASSVGRCFERRQLPVLQPGVVHVQMGDHERDPQAGGTAFIPAHTWVSLMSNDTQQRAWCSYPQRLGSRITCDLYRCRRMRSRLP